MKNLLSIILVILIPICFVTDILFGSVQIPLQGFIDILQGNNDNSLWYNIIVRLRLPRAISAILVGIALPISGLLMQTLFKNPLADPYILGVSTGASLGVAFYSLMGGITLGIFSFLNGSLGTAISALIGSSIIILLILVIAPKIKNIASLLIIGIMFGSLTSAIVNMLQYFSNPDEVHNFLLWTMGSLANIDKTEIALMVIVIVPITIATLLIHKPLDAILLGENYAHSLGVNTGKTKIVIIIFSTILASIVTAFAGPIGFVVYSSDIRKKRKFGVMYYEKSDDILPIPVVGSGVYKNTVFEVYTDTKYYKVEGGVIVEEQDNYLGEVPIIEYKANNARQGSFEIVLPLLDALNAAYSDRMDAVDSFVQAFMKFVNCDIDKEGLELLKEYGAIKIKSEPNLPADVELVTAEMNQDQTQTMVNSIDAQINVICGLPNRNGGLSTSDTGRAVELRDGFVNAEIKAKDSEGQYREDDKNALKIMFKICKVNGFCDLKVSDVKAQFTRRNYDNLQSKCQVFVAMLQQPDVDPKLAFECSGMFTDPERAYQESMEYKKEQEKLLQEQQAKMATTPSGDGNGQGSPKNANNEGDQISNPILKSASETH